MLALSGELEPLGARRHLAVVVLVRREELDPREELGPPRHEPLEVGATEEEELAPVDGLARRRRRRRLKQAHLADELADVPLGSGSATSVGRGSLVYEARLYWRSLR